MGIKIKIAFSVNWNHFCSILCHYCVEIDQALPQCWLRNQGHDAIDENIDDDITHERIEDPELEPLINYTPRPITMAASVKYTQ